LTRIVPPAYSKVMQWKTFSFLLLASLVIVLVMLLLNFLGLIRIPFLSLPLGYVKATELTKQFKNFQTRQSINIQLSGVLEQKDTNSWTLGKDGQQITVTNESASPPNYLRRPTAGNITEVISSSEIPVGSTVTLTLTIDPDSGKLTVMNIIID